MTNETPAKDVRSVSRRDGRSVGRRTLLQALAAAGALGAAAGTTAAASDQDDESDDDADPLYVVEQGDERYEITPLSGSEPAESFYDLRIPEKYTGDNGATDPGDGPYYMSVGTQDLQRPSTSLLFFYDGPEGVSLVAVHDADGDDGGSATWTVSGVPTDAEWLVKDDFYLFESGEKPESNYDNWNTDGANHQIDWTWGATRGDGGVLGYLDPGVSLGINPQFNEAATLYDEHYEGEIDEWQLLSADGEGGVTRSTLDLDAPLTVAIERASTDGESDETEFDLSVSPPDAKINVESEGLVPVDIDCPDPSEIDVDSISFGTPEAVDDGDGASPKQHESDDGTCKVHFPIDKTDIDPKNALAKVVGKIDGGDGGDGGDDGDSSFSLNDAIDAFDPTDDDDDEDGDDEDSKDEKKGNGRGPPDHANDDDDNGKDEGNGKGGGNGKGNGRGGGNGKGN
ncbi:hypothetical protein [Halosimplex amylolyticum]|uniref:hypothetical protein n=1 Tax=Halosimplex amylolyticum TaxID=3396616 RepID=UPI003F5629CD